MAKIDFHVHSKFSIDSLTSIRSIYRRAKKAGLDGLALTDHNEFRGVKEFQKLLREERDRNFLLVPGMELKMDKGEIQALFLQEPITTRKLDEIIDQTRDQDSLLNLPHPFDTIRQVIPKVREMTKKQLQAIDAVEVFNSRNAFQKSNQLALAFAKKHGKAQLAGSDAHWRFEIGNAWVEVDGTTLEEIHRGIKRRKTKVYGKPSTPAVLAMTKAVKTVKKIL